MTEPRYNNLISDFIRSLAPQRIVITDTVKEISIQDNQTITAFNQGDVFFEPYDLPKFTTAAIVVPQYQENKFSLSNYQRFINAVGLKFQNQKNLNIDERSSLEYNIRGEIFIPALLRPKLKVYTQEPVTFQADNATLEGPYGAKAKANICTTIYCGMLTQRNRYHILVLPSVESYENIIENEKDIYTFVTNLTQDKMPTIPSKTIMRVQTAFENAEFDLFYLAKSSQNNSQRESTQETLDLKLEE